MTTSETSDVACPAEAVIKMLSGKLKPQLFRHALNGPIRFSSMLREIKGSNKQSLAVALREMEEQGLLNKIIISEKPLHIEYQLSETGKKFIPVFVALEKITKLSRTI
jgi:DNA-binding HxlR family transcriptional regulator